MSISSYHLRDLIHYSYDAIKDMPVYYRIIFDDGSGMLVYQNESIYSWFFWQTLKKYPSTRLIKKHHVRGITGTDEVDASTHLKLCSAILESICEDNGIYLPEEMEPIHESIYQTISDAQREVVRETDEWVVGVDITDFIEVTTDETIQAYRKELVDDTSKFDYVYEKSMKHLRTHPKFANNSLNKIYSAGLVSTRQLNQCVIARGFPAEVNGVIYREPILSNYTEGLTSFYDFVTDSRTAAKSHFNQNSSLEDSEYMARKFRLYAMVLERIHYEDCGTTKLMPWLVRGKVFTQNGVEQYPGDLPMLVGKYYKTSLDGEYSVITGSEKHLDGKRIYLRNALRCETPNPHEICHICAGKLSRNISRFANIGHLGGISLTSILSQMILSVKHVNTSSAAAQIHLNDYDRRYIHTGVNMTEFYLRPDFATKEVKITVGKGEVFGLSDIRDIGSLEAISLPRISSISAFSFTYTETVSMVVSTVITVTQKKKKAMMSRELLSYLQNEGWVINDDDDFVFDMKNWDYEQPIFVMQNTEESFSALADEVESFVLSGQKSSLLKNTKDADYVFLQELFDLVNHRKLRINILCFEILVYGLLTYSDNSYALARNSKKPVLSIGSQLTRFRSMGPALSYQGQRDTMYDPINYFQGTRPDSPMDVFLAPREVVDYYQDFEMDRLKNVDV